MAESQAKIVLIRGFRQTRIRLRVSGKPGPYAFSVAETSKKAGAQ
jgi:hypothetical protein